MSKAITSCKKALAYLLTAAMVLGMAVTSPVTAETVKASGLGVGAIAIADLPGKITEGAKTDAEWKTTSEIKSGTEWITVQSIIVDKSGTKSSNIIGNTAAGGYAVNDEITLEFETLPGYEVTSVTVTNGTDQDPAYTVANNKSENIKVAGAITIDSITVAKKKYNIKVDSSSVGSVTVQADAYHGEDVTFTVSDADDKQVDLSAVTVAVDTFTVGNVNGTSSNNWQIAGADSTIAMNTDFASDQTLAADDGSFTIPGGIIVGDVTIKTAAVSGAFKITADVAEGTEYKVVDSTDDSIDLSRGIFGSKSANVKFVVKDDEGNVVKNKANVKAVYVNGDNFDSTKLTKDSGYVYTLDSEAIINAIKIVVTGNETLNITAGSVKNYKDSTAVDGVEKIEMGSKSLPGTFVNDGSDVLFKVTTKPGWLLKKLTVSQTVTSGEAPEPISVTKGTTAADKALGNSSGNLFTTETDLAEYEYNFTLKGAAIKGNITIDCEVETDKTNKYDIKVQKATVSGSTTTYNNFGSSAYAVVDADSAGFLGTITTASHVGAFGEIATLRISEVKDHYVLNSVKVLEKDGDTYTDVTSGMTTSKISETVTDYNYTMTNKEVYFVVDCQPVMKKITIDNSKVSGIDSLIISLVDVTGSETIATIRKPWTDKEFEIMEGHKLTFTISGVSGAKSVTTTCSDSTCKRKDAVDNKNGNYTYEIASVTKDVTFTLESSGITHAITADVDTSKFMVKAAIGSGEYKKVGTGTDDLKTVDDNASFKIKIYNAAGTTVIANADFSSAKIYDAKYKIGSGADTAITAGETTGLTATDAIKITIKNAEYTAKESNSDAGFYITTKTKLDNGHNDKTAAAAVVGAGSGNIDKDMPKIVYGQDYEFVVATAEYDNTNSHYSDNWTLCTDDLKVTYKIGSSGSAYEAKAGTAKGSYVIPAKQTVNGTDVEVKNDVTIKVEKVYKTEIEISDAAKAVIDDVSYLINTTATAGTKAGGSFTAATAKVKNNEFTYTSTDINNGNNKIFINVPIKTDYRGIYELVVKVDDGTTGIGLTQGTGDNVGHYVNATGISTKSNTTGILNHKIKIDIKDVNYTLALTKVYNTDANNVNFKNATLKVVEVANGQETEITAKTTTPAITYELKAAGEYYLVSNRTADDIADYGELEVKSSEPNVDPINKVNSASGERWAIPAATENTVTNGNTITVTAKNLSSGANLQQKVFVKAPLADKYVITSTAYESNIDGVTDLWEADSVETDGTGGVSTGSIRYAHIYKPVSITVKPGTGREVVSVKAYECKAADGTSETIEYTTTKNGDTYTIAGKEHGTTATGILFVVETKLTKEDNYNVKFSLDTGVEKVTVTDVGSKSGLTDIVASPGGYYSTAAKDTVKFTLKLKSGYTIDELLVNGTDAKNGYISNNTDPISVAYAADATKGTEKPSLVTVTTKKTAAPSDLYFSIKSLDEHITLESVDNCEEFTDGTDKIYKIEKGTTDDVLFKLKVAKGYMLKKNASGEDLFNAAGWYRTTTVRKHNDDGSWTYSFKMNPSLTDIGGTNVTNGGTAGTTTATALVFTINNNVATKPDVKFNVDNTDTTYTVSYKVNGENGTNTLNGTYYESDASEITEGDKITITVPANKDLYDKATGEQLNKNIDRKANATDTYEFTAALDKPEDEAKTYFFTLKDRTGLESFTIDKILDKTNSKNVTVADSIESDPRITYTITVKGTNPDGSAITYTNDNLKVVKDKDAKYSSDATVTGGTGSIEVTVIDTVTYTITATHVVDGVNIETVKTLTFTADAPAEKVDVMYNNAKVENGVVEIEANSENEVITIVPKAKDDTVLPASSVTIKLISSSENIIATEKDGVITVKTKTGTTSADSMEVQFTSKALDTAITPSLEIRGSERVLTVSDVTAKATKTKLTLAAEGTAKAKTGVKQYYEFTVTDKDSATKYYIVEADSALKASYAVDINAQTGDKYIVSARMFEVTADTSVTTGESTAAYANSAAVFSRSVAAEDAVVPDVVPESISLSRGKVDMRTGGEPETITVTVLDGEGNDVTEQTASLSADTTAGIKAVLSGKTITITAGEGVEGTAEYTVTAGTLSEIFTVVVKARQDDPTGDDYDKPGDDGLKKDISDVITSVELQKSGYEFLGYNKRVEPKIKKINSTEKIKEGVDYKVTYADCEAAGTGTVIITGINDYSGEVTKEFKIAQRNIKSAIIVAGTISNTTDVDLMAEVTGRIGVSDKNINLSPDEDFEVTEARVNGKKVEYTITGIGNYSGTKSGKISVVDLKGKTDLSLAEVSAEGQTFTGKAIKPDVSVTLDGEPVNKDNYSVSYKNNTNVGWATVTVKGKGKAYAGTAVGFFEITVDDSENEMNNIENATVTVKGKTYTGKLQKPSVTVKMGKTSLKKGKDYLVFYSNELNAGTATVIIRGIGNYYGEKANTADTQFIIAPAKFSGVSVKKINGKQGLYFNGKPLVAGEDFEVIEPDGGIVAKNGKYEIEIRALEGEGHNFTANKTKKIKGTKDKIDWAQLGLEEPTE